MPVKEIYFLVAQFILQLAILLGLFAGLAKKNGEPLIQRRMLDAVGISVTTVLLQAFLSHRAGWMVLSPVLGICVLLLMRASWTAMWTTCVTVTLFCSFYLTLTVGIGFETENIAVRKETARKDPLRYNQIAEQIDVFAGKELPKPDAQPKKILKKKPQTEDQDRNMPKPDWKAARETVQSGGSLTLHSGERVAYINDQICATGTVVRVFHNGYIYRWQLTGIQAHGIELEPLDALPADAERGL